MSVPPKPDPLPEDGKTLRDFMSVAVSAEGSDYWVEAGAALAPHTKPAAKPALIEALRQVYDPELPVNIYDLGLIYRHDIDEDGQVAVEMTLTAPGCPVAGTFPAEVAQRLAALPGVGQVRVALVWDPPWHSGLMSEDARLALGLD